MGAVLRLDDLPGRPRELREHHERRRREREADARGADAQHGGAAVGVLLELPHEALAVVHGRVAVDADAAHLLLV